MTPSIRLKGEIWERRSLDMGREDGAAERRIEMALKPGRMRSADTISRVFLPTMIRTS
jgi:hypothetical protein